MSLQNRDRLIWIGLVVAWVLWWIRYPVSSNLKWKFLSWLLVIVIGVVCSNILGRRSLRLFRTALATEEIPTAQREHANLAGFWKVSVQPRPSGRSAGVHAMMAFADTMIVSTKGNHGHFHSIDTSER